jgi:mannosyltransferase
VKRLYDQRVAWISGLLAATSACLVQFSQEARSYSLLILLCVASYYFFIRLIQEDKLWYVAAYVVVSIAALYAHFFAALIICSQAASLLWLPRPAIRLGRVVVAGTAIVIAALPISFYILRRDVGQLYWVQPTTVAEVYKLTIFFAGASKAVAAILSVLSLVAIGAAIAGHRQQLRTRSEVGWRFAVPLLWAVLPVLLTILVSLHKPLFVHRYLLVALPGYLILIGIGLASIRNKRGLWSVLVVFVALSFVSIAQGYHRPVEDWRGAVDHVLSSTQPQDTILIYIPYGANDFFFYAERRERRGLRTRFVRIDAAQSVAQLESIDSPRSWLLLYPSPHVAEDAPLFEKTLTQKYAVVDRKQFKGIEVLLFSQPLKPQPYRPPAESAPRP